MHVIYKKKGLGFFIFLAVFAGITAIVMLLWNALIPGIIGWAAISYWQSAGLLILCRFLLGGFGKPFRRGHFFEHKGHHMHHKKMEDFHKKMEGMSPDERREYIRKQMRGFDRDFRNPSPFGKQNNSEETGENKD